jgi:DNA-binding MarR family transcriptional regulator
MATDYTLAEIVDTLTQVITEMQTQALKSSKFSALSMRQVYYLNMINQLGNPSPTELAQQLGLSKPSVSAVIDKLTTDGFLRKVPSPEDRRSYHLHLTKKGKEVEAEHQGVHQDIALALTRGLNQHEVQQLTQLLQKILWAAGK